jgi:hypothetical protein
MIIVGDFSITTDEALCKWIEQVVPTCQGDYLFAKGYEVVTDGFVSTGEISEIP